LNPNAQVEGIATNGTDIWLVDNKFDKVLKYTGGAGRLSGSQNATQYFFLAGGEGPEMTNKQLEAFDPIRRSG
jgi:hypothetical protein